MHPRVSQNPRRGFGPLGPVCCPTLLVAVRAGLPHRLGVREGLSDGEVKVGSRPESSMNQVCDTSSRQ
jgi:hypothetical protein